MAILEAMIVSSALETRSREELVALDAIAVPSLSPKNRPGAGLPGHRTARGIGPVRQPGP